MAATRGTRRRTKKSTPGPRATARNTATHSNPTTLRSRYSRYTRPDSATTVKKTLAIERVDGVAEAILQSVWTRADEAVPRWAAWTTLRPPVAVASAG